MDCGGEGGWRGWGRGWGVQCVWGGGCCRWVGGVYRVGGWVGCSVCTYIRMHCMCAVFSNWLNSVNASVPNDPASVILGPTSLWFTGSLFLLSLSLQFVFFHLPNHPFCWLSFLKHVLGRDVTRVTMPVYFNEPLSFTQRIVEDIEYVDLLHKAAGKCGPLQLACVLEQYCTMGV